MTDNPTTERPCVGLPPDTDPCPLCGAWLSDACRSDHAWRIDPADPTHVERWDGRLWSNDCWFETPDEARLCVARNIQEARANGR